jgi:phosphoribosylaminoimidazole-succinocarboxamide synthase
MLMEGNTNRKLIAEGKTKRIYTAEDSRQVVEIENKDDITAGDGARHDILEGKAQYATATTCNCFELLKRDGLRTHYVSKVNERTFRAHRMDMIPLELVARRIATGSYLKRRPDIPEGTIFNDVIIEFFYKDDIQHDPLVIPDYTGGRILYFDPKQPLASGFMKEEPMNAMWRDLYSVLPEIVTLTHRTFAILERAWYQQGVTLVDLKIECGRDTEYPNIIRVADVIDNDSWRIWPGGDKAQMMDKQVYRDLENSSPQALGAIKDNYKWVAEATGKFLEASS